MTSRPFIYILTGSAVGFQTKYVEERGPSCSFGDWSKASLQNDATPLKKAILTWLLRMECVWIHGLDISSASRGEFALLYNGICPAP